MGFRQNKKIIRINRLDLYDEFFDERGVRQIRQYMTPVMNYPNTSQKLNLSYDSHIWKVGDRFYKLAHKYYGDSRYWWVIAWYNKKPTESHVALGDVLSIPLPLSTVLTYYDQE